MDAYLAKSDVQLSFLFAGERHTSRLQNLRPTAAAQSTARLATNSRSASRIDRGNRRSGRTGRSRRGGRLQIIVIGVGGNSTLVRGNGRSRRRASAAV